MELRYGWETELEWLWVYLFAAFGAVFPFAVLEMVSERAPGATKPVLVVLLFAVPYGTLVVWLQRTGRWRGHARLLSRPDGLTLVDSGGRRVSIPSERLQVQRLVVRVVQGEDPVVTHERRFAVVEDSSTGEGWSLAEMAWPVDERFWQELGVEPRTGTTIEGGRRDLQSHLPNVRHFGTVDAGYSALAWLILNMAWVGVVSGLATVLGAHIA